jgi:hypothetical protein
MTACPACDGYTPRESDELDQAGVEHHAALESIRWRERDGRPLGPRWPGDWSADAFHWTAPNPTRDGGRA